MARNPIDTITGGKPETARKSREKATKLDPKEGFRLIAAFTGIDDPELRNAMVIIAEALKAGTVRQ